MRVRKVVTRSGKRYRGKYPSRKLGRMVQWESFLERDAVLLFEYHQNVVSYQEQPSIETYYGEDGSPLKYFPDITASFIDGRVVVFEIKPETRLATKKAQAKYTAIARRFQEQGRTFRILTERDIRREPLHANLRRIDDITRGHKPPTDDAILEGGPTWTLDEAARQIGSHLEVLLRVRYGNLTFDFEKPLTGTTQIRIANLNKGGCDDAFSI